MKTVALPRTRGSIFSTLFVVGGLTALYFYRKNGGSVWSLFRRGFSGVSSARGYLRGTAVDNQVSSGGRGSRAGRAQEIPTAPEDLDRIPST